MNAKLNRVPDPRHPRLRVCNTRQRVKVCQRSLSDKIDSLSSKNDFHSHSCIPSQSFLVRLLNSGACEQSITMFAKIYRCVAWLKLMMFKFDITKRLF
ncbi:hypothetical protein Nepgr_016825 [Nepenthes gracilis]|uniref:Uncharacterized protein n=1 Tax=Nepenthes gracilis TaxID=150966 RepID=A0AAD3XSH9_NEPGR|nr:hypothetical protein Nepgr_016825 [Nepenthes gracilis]